MWGRELSHTAQPLDMVLGQLQQEGDIHTLPLAAANQSPRKLAHEVLKKTSCNPLDEIFFFKCYDFKEQNQINFLLSPLLLS